MLTAEKVKLLGVSKVIEEYLKQKYEEERKERKIGYYFPSHLPYCLRRQYWDYKEPVEPSDESLKIFFIGDLIHEAIQQILERKLKAKSERKILIPVDPVREIFITGRADSVFEDEEGNTYVVEIKTVSSLTYRDRQTNEIREMEKPKPHHVLQIMPYLYAFNAKGIIVYIERNSFKTKEFEIRKDPAILQQVFDRARKLHEYLLARKLPPPEARNDPVRKWECNYCPYKWKCFTKEFL